MASSSWSARPTFVAHSVVPVFLFISGFLLAFDRSPDLATFTRRRRSRLALPMLVWMGAALAFEAWMRGGLTREILTSFALFNVEGQFYYLFVLLVLTFTAYPLRHVPAHGWSRSSGPRSSRSSRRTRTTRHSRLVDCSQPSRTAIR